MIGCVKETEKPPATSESKDRLNGPRGVLGRSFIIIMASGAIRAHSSAVGSPLPTLRSAVSYLQIY